jgi:D-alanine--poly(phosphoribitol) ligase subunit 2
MKDKLKVFIEEELLSEQKEVNYDDNLLVSGLVDSLGFIKMIQFLERSFGVTIPPKDMLIENFASIDAVEKYMTKLLK